MTTSLQLASINLRITDLARSIEFYTHHLGFVLTRKSAGDAELATSSGGSPILFLTEKRDAIPASPENAGLFHAALLLPSRAALGVWLKFAVSQDVDFDGFADHGVSEAIYLSDPDGNGLEFYADFPRSAWPLADGQLAMTTQPLSVRNLLAQASGPADAPLAGAHWGHLHLRVTDLEQGEAYYRAALDVVVTQRSFPGARFLAADGYHHHLGLNTWGNPLHAQPTGGVGLISARFIRAGITAPQQKATPEGFSLELEPKV